MPVIDMHAHIYPDKIIPRAAESVRLFYDIPMSVHEGSVACLMGLCADPDIAWSVVCSVAVKAQTAPVNDFIAPSCGATRLWRLPFGSHDKQNSFSHCAIILKVRNNERVNARAAS